jgi:hypothetical protein
MSDAEVSLHKTRLRKTRLRKTRLHQASLHRNNNRDGFSVAPAP